MSEAPQPASAWYVDPSHAGQYRWWDGAAWTDHVAPLQQAAAVSPAQTGLSTANPAQHQSAIDELTQSPTIDADARANEVMAAEQDKSRWFRRGSSGAELRGYGYDESTLIPGGRWGWGYGGYGGGGYGNQGDSGNVSNALNVLWIASLVLRFVPGGDRWANRAAKVSRYLSIVVVLIAFLGIFYAFQHRHNALTTPPTTSDPTAQTVPATGAAPAGAAAPATSPATPASATS